MINLGDFPLGATIRHKFATRDPFSAAMTNLADSPVVAAYPDDSTTQVTAGITLTQPFDSTTGFAHLDVVASGGNGYAANTTYYLTLTAGTVGGVAVAGTVLARFSIELTGGLNAALSQPGQETPAASQTPLGILRYLFKAWRNRSTQTSSTYKLYNDDASTVDQKASFSYDGTTADRGEVATGP